MTDELERLHHALDDRYAIERELGRGGMGTVYLADDRKHGRRVAMKVLSPEISSAINTDRFRREIETIANLTHPHILPLHDSGRAGDYLYFVMPYVEGESLRDRLERGPLPAPEALRLAREVAGALDHAHRHGVVHRDVKPENILLLDDHAVLADFGIARVPAGHATLTAEGIAIGTPAYMSPEQARGRPVDGRSDIYALGCVLYEMLAGVPPFTGAEVGDVLRQHLAVEPPLHHPDLPAGVRDILGQALAKQPDRRFQNAGLFAAALRQAELSQSTQAVLVPHRPARYALGVVVGAALVAGAWWLAAVRAPDALQIRAIAVLPLQNLTGDSTQEYFVDGMTESLIATLAQIEALRVISRTSVMRFKGTSQPLRTIARDLGVDAVVEGSVARDGGRVRVTAQLVDAGDRHLWAASYDRELRDVLTLQTEVAQAVAREIQVTLTAAERERLTRVRTVDPQAYEAYLLGRFHWNRRTEADFRAAIRAFERAIAVDPAYALPHSGLADSYILLAEWRHVPAVEVVPVALAAARRALALDSTLAEAWTSLGEVLISTFDWDGAERAFRRALELNPNYATGRQWFGFFLSKMGRHEEAIAELERALALDPLSLIIKTEFARVYIHAGRFEDAGRMIAAAEALDPNFVDIPWTRGNLFLESGRAREAVPWLERARQSVGFAPELAEALALAGRKADARAVLAEMLAERAAMGLVVSSTHTAGTYAALGEHDRALTLLEEAHARGADDFLSYLKVSTVFDPLRTTPRFRALMRQLRLE